MPVSSAVSLILSGLQAVFHSTGSTSSGVGGLIVGGVHGVFEWILTAVATWLAELPAWILGQFVSAGYTRVLLDNPWAQALVLFAQGIAGSILGLRLAWEAFHHHVLREQGTPTDVIGLVRNASIAAGSIFAFPWLSVRLILFGNDLATGIVSVLGAQTSAIPAAFAQIILLLLNTVGSANIALLVLVVVVLLVCLVLLVLIFVQAMIRTVEAFVAGVVGPIMAVGWMSSGGGTAAVWWGDLIVLVLAQSVQVMLLYAAIEIVTASGLAAAIRPFLLLATLWVTYRTPHMLQQYAYRSGVGGGIATTGNAVAGAVARRFIA